MFTTFNPAISTHLSAPGALAPTGPRPARGVVKAVEHLPFTVRLVRTEADLDKAVQIRHAAYARHLEPRLSEALRQSEPQDTMPGTVILLAESKLDGSPLGTMRIRTNTHGPLALQESVDLPEWMQGKSLAEATRLGITQERVGRLVKVMLFKAYYLYCIEKGIDYMVITARSPIDRQYDRMLFRDVHPGMGYVPLSHVFNLPHRVMFLDVFNAEANWDDADHPMLGFMCDTLHPDLRIGA
jgi:hypothetical protein